MGNYARVGSDAQILAAIIAEVSRDTEVKLRVRIRNRAHRHWMAASTASLDRQLVERKWARLFGALMRVRSNDKPFRQRFADLTHEEKVGLQRWIALPR